MTLITGAILINNQAALRQIDIPADPNLIHVINHVLLPDEEPFVTKVETTPTTPPADIARTNPRPNLQGDRRPSARTNGRGQNSHFDSRVEENSESRPNVRQGSRSEARPNLRPNNRAEENIEPSYEGDVEPRPVVRPVSRPDSRTNLRPKNRPENYPEVGHEDSVESSPNVKPDSYSDPHSEARPHVRTNYRPRPRIEDDSDPIPNAHSQLPTSARTSRPKDPFVLRKGKKVIRLNKIISLTHINICQF